MKAHAIVSLARGRKALDRLIASLAPAAPAFVQLREKGLPDRELLRLARAVASALPARTAFLVNGRPDIAVAAGARGVQLPADGLPAGDVRKAFPPPFLVGVSCHSLAEVARAADDGADFALLAPIYAPFSKPGDTRPPLGPEAIDALGGAPAVHVLGGMTLDRLRSWPPARRASVGAVAGIALFADAEDPAATVRALAGIGET